ncbi:MAG: OsmC family protein [Myxococcota bacterium]
MTSRDSVVAQRQDPLRERYGTDPAAAVIQDGAVARVGASTDPFHGEVIPHNADGRAIPFGIHRAVGGDHDLPNPGDLLSSALAACMHSTLRMVADRLGIDVVDLEVRVSAEVDVRGCLLVDPQTPVGFRTMECTTHLTAGPSARERDLELLQKMTEQCCVVFRTLKGGTTLRTNWHVQPAQRDWQGGTR